MGSCHGRISQPNPNPNPKAARPSLNHEARLLVHRIHGQMRPQGRLRENSAVVLVPLTTTWSRTVGPTTPPTSQPV